MAAKKTAREFLKIGEVARLVGVSASSLRNWETLGLFNATRTEGGYRLYSHDTIAQLKQIQYLRKSKRVNIPGIQFQRERDTESFPPLSPEMFVPELPGRLLAMRLEKQLPLSEVSRRIGMSARALGAIERGHALPSVAVVQKLAEVYDTNVLFFFNVNGEQRKLVRRKDRRILRFGPGVRMELLAFGATMMEPHLIRIAPRSTSGGSYSHEGEELLFMLQGKLEIWLDEIERYVLEPGDSLYFESRQVHRWSSLTNRECVLIWINAPVTF